MSHSAMAIRYRRKVWGKVHVHPNAQMMNVVRTTPSVKMTHLAFKDANEFHAAVIAADVRALCNSGEEVVVVLDSPWLRALHDLTNPILSDTILSKTAP